MEGAEDAEGEEGGNGEDTVQARGEGRLDEAGPGDDHVQPLQGGKPAPRDYRVLPHQHSRLNAIGPQEKTALGGALRDGAERAGRKDEEIDRMGQGLGRRDKMLLKAVIVVTPPRPGINVEHGKREAFAQNEGGHLASGHAQPKIAAHMADEIEADWRSYGVLAICA